MIRNDSLYPSIAGEVFNSMNMLFEQEGSVRKKSESGYHPAGIGGEGAEGPGGAAVGERQPGDGEGRMKTALNVNVKIWIRIYKYIDTGDVLIYHVC